MNETHEKFNCEENKILMSNDGSYAGYFNYFNKKLFITSHCNYIDIINNKITNNYLFYYLKLNQSIFLKKEDEGGYQKGQAQPSINIPKIYKEFKISILSLSHQEEIIECIESIIKGNYKILDRLVLEFKDKDLFKFLIIKDYDTFKTALCYIERLIDYENNWKILYDIQRKGAFKIIQGVEKKLSEICKLDIGGTPDTKNLKFWNNGNNVWVSISDLNNDIIKDTKKYITDEGVNNSNVKLIKKGSIMMSFKLTLGKMGIAGKDMYCNEAIAFFSNIKVNEKYFWYILKNYDFKKQKHLFNSQIGSSLNKKSLGKLPLFIPSLEDQEKVVKMIEEIEKTESDYNKSIENIKKLVETIYTNIEMCCSSITTNIVKNEDDNISISTNSTNLTSNSTKTYKINGIKCIKKDGNYYEFKNDKLIATTNNEGEVELIEEEEEEEEEEFEYITIGKIEYILIDENVYTIINNKPSKLYGKFINNKFIKSNEKIIIKGKKQEKTLEELESELG